MFVSIDSRRVRVHMQLYLYGKDTKLCEVCGERFEYNVDAKTQPLYCKECKHKKDLEKYARYNEKR